MGLDDWMRDLNVWNVMVGVGMNKGDACIGYAGGGEVRLQSIDLCRHGGLLSLEGREEKGSETSMIVLEIFPYLYRRLVFLFLSYLIRR